MTTNTHILLFTLITLLSCARKELTEDEYNTYLNDPENGLTQEKTINNVKYSVTHRPTDLLVLQEMTDSNASRHTIDSLRAKYNKRLYFVLSMSIDNKDLLRTAPRGMQEFGHWVNKLAFEMENNVCMTTSQKDTVAMLGNHFSRMYGMSPTTSILFVFEKEYMEQEWFKFEIKDLGLQSGDVKFKIYTEKLRNTPYVKFN